MSRLLGKHHFDDVVRHQRVCCYKKPIFIQLEGYICTQLSD